MANKRFLKVLSCGTLVSLLVTPLILNGVSDVGKAEEVIDVKRLSNLNSNDLISTQSDVSYQQLDMNNLFSSKQNCSNSSVTGLNGSVFNDSKSFVSFVTCNGAWTSGGRFYYSNYFDGLTSGRNYRLTVTVTNCGFEDNFINDDEGYESSCMMFVGGDNTKAHYNGYGDVDYSSFGTKYGISEFGSEDINNTFVFNFTASSSELNITAWYKWSTYYNDYKNNAISLMFKLEEEKSVDSIGPVVSANKGYSISLPVGTNERVTLDWIKQNHLFYAYDIVDGDVTDSMEFFGNAPSINYNKIGTYDITLMFHDKSYNYSSATFTLVIGDFTKPSYTINNTIMYVECPSTLSDSDLLNNVSFTDNYSDVTKTIVVNNYNKNTSCGTYSVTIRGADSSGNYSEATFNVCVRDTIAPSVTGVTNGSTIRNGTFNISDSGSGIKSVTLDGVSKTLSGGKFEFVGSSYKDGSHTLIATDNSGNKTTISFVSDSTPPGVVFSGNSVNYNSGNVYDGSKICTLTGYPTKFRIDSKDYNCSADSSGTYKINFSTLNLSSGIHTLIAYDNLGNASISYSFYYDSVGITCDIVESKIYSINDSFTISCSSGILYASIGSSDIYRNNSDYLVSYSHTFKMSDILSSLNEKNILTISDYFGNTKYISLTFDNVAPTISGVINGSRYNNNLNIKFTDSVSNIKSYKLNDVLISVDSSSRVLEISLNSSNLKQGTNTISEVTDSSGNVNSDVISFIYDTESPDIQGPNPVKTGKNITAEDVKAMFIATDNVDGECSIEAVSSTIQASVGNYVVVLRSTDKTGNSKEISVNVNICDVEPPVIFIRKDSLVVIKIVEKTELTYENLLSIFKANYPDYQNINEEEVQINVLSNGFVVGSDDTRSIDYEVVDLKNNVTTTYTMVFSSYSLVNDDKKDDESDNKKDDVTPDDVDKEETKSWWSKIWSGIGNFFKKVWNWISGFFGSDKKDDVTTTDKADTTSVEDGRLVKDGVETEEVDSEYIIW